MVRVFSRGILLILSMNMSQWKSWWKWRGSFQEVSYWFLILTAWNISQWKPWWKWRGSSQEGSFWFWRMEYLTVETMVEIRNSTYCGNEMSPHADTRCAHYWYVRWCNVWVCISLSLARLGCCVFQRPGQPPRLDARYACNSCILYRRDSKSTIHGLPRLHFVLLALLHYGMVLSASMQ